MLKFYVTFSGVETMSTMEGKKLLCGGGWGRVRHPNHVGAILIYCSWALLCISSPLHPLPIAFPILVTLFFVHRSLRDYSHCDYRYGAAWKRYVSKVRYHLIPKVF